MSGFPSALPFVLQREGGYVHHPDDRGGSTNMGVTQKSYDRWRRNHNLYTSDVLHITEDEVASVYHEEAWVRAHCDAFWWPLSLAVFDAAVNHGPEWAIKLLQRAVGATVDGIVGPQTMGAVSRSKRLDLLARLRWERLLYYARIVEADPSQAVFLEGWVNRMRHLDERMAEDVGLAA